ncbi:molybdenum ABC transporter, periplasmic molybdate-binding protein [Geitlerinema sp. PCC 7407]|nr:molybdenum ABC transporter, periplasmic molybdate-binding protein [Geitlerinema sp. PCC 7407]
MSQGLCRVSRRRLLWGAAGWGAIALVSGCRDRPVRSAGITLTVGIAASLIDLFRAIQPVFEAQEPTVSLRFTVAASGLLQRQIEQRAPIDVFASAGEAQMDALAAQSLLLPNSRAVFVQNRLVIVQPAGQDPWIRALEDLGQPRLRRLALGNPETVPAGRYARAALESAGLYQPLAQAQKLVFAENVRQALTYVEQGNVDAGLVYATDARGRDRAQVVYTLPADATPPIRYPVAVVAETPYPAEAQRFVAFLLSEAGQAIARRFGFLAPP